MRLSVYGAGAWGTALAVQAAQRHDVVLWARNPQQVAAMQRDGENAAYLAGTPLPSPLAVTADLDAARAHGEGEGGMHIVATPMAALRELLGRLAGEGAAGIAWLCKGFEQHSGALGHEVAAAVAPGRAVAVLSGPSFAAEVARGQPTALVAASHDAALCARLADAFHGGSLRVYTSNDPVGVEVGGAVKNVLAIATGIADGLQLGLNARAAIITRGLAEMTRLGLALGGRADTFMGLSGLGDLVLTATGDLSRNRRVGLLLAEGRALPDVLATLGHVAEGVYSARTVLARAVRVGVEMPIAEAVVAVLDGHWSAAEAVHRLVQRTPKPEAAGA